jgi:excisionase family DNA binding protein
MASTIAWGEAQARAPMGTVRALTQAQKQATSAWQESLWAKWRTPEAWPDRLSVAEAAAYLRVSPDTIRRLVTLDRTGRARLAHQRIGVRIIIRKPSLDEVGMVNARNEGG